MITEAHEQVGRPWFWLAALLALGALLFSANLGGYDLWPPDEPRFAQVTREILESGDPVLLTVNGEPYQEKTPLLFWMMAALSAPFGDVSETTARMPTVLAALVTLLATFLIARRLYGDRTALWSVMILMICFRFWWQSRTAQTDMVLTACVALAGWAFLEWHHSRALRWLVAHALFTAAAVCTKGPPGFMIPALLVAAFYWRSYACDPRDNRRAAGVVIGTAFAVSAGLVGLWLLPSYSRAAEMFPVTADQALAGNLFRQTVGRFALGVSKAQWPWYYLNNLPVDWLPWSLFLPWALPWWWRNRKTDEGMRFLMAWVVPAVVVFSISVGKRQLYLLPLYPAMAILWARALMALAQEQANGAAPGRGWTRFWAGTVALGLLAAPVDPEALTIAAFGLLGLAAGARPARAAGLCQAGLLISLGVAPLALPLTPHAHLWNPALTVVGLVAFALGGHALWCVMRDEKAVPQATVLRFAAVYLMTAMVVFPVVNGLKGAAAFCEPVRMLSEQGREFRLYSAGFSREEYIFYSRKKHIPVFTGMVDMETPPGMSVMDLARLQRRLRDDMVGAATSVTLANPAAITDTEVATLRAAIQRAVLEDQKVVKEHADLFETGLEQAIRAFHEELEREGTALFFVQEEDWRWLVAIRPELRALHVLKSRAVGNRHVLLVANEPADSIPGGD